MGRRDTAVMEVESHTGAGGGEGEGGGREGEGKDGDGATGGRGGGGDTGGGETQPALRGELDMKPECGPLM